MNDAFVIAIVGSQTLDDPDWMNRVLNDALRHYAIDCGLEPVALRLSDGAGADFLALRWARGRGYPRTVFCADRTLYDYLIRSHGYWDAADEQQVLAADWDSRTDGVNAGRIRNSAMIAGTYPSDPRGDWARADALVVINAPDSTAALSDDLRNALATAKTSGVPMRLYGAFGAGEGAIQL